MLTPAERDRAYRFELWLRGDTEKHEPPVQLDLFAGTIQARKECQGEAGTSPGVTAPPERSAYV